MAEQVTTEHSSSTVNIPLEEIRKMCLWTPLPDDFLRVLPFKGGALDHMNLNEELLLQVDIIEARLAYNYGLLPMSLYCRIRIGDARYETQTASNAAKHPIWNESFRCWLRGNASHINVTIFAEKLFSDASQVAHVSIPFPQGYQDGVSVNRWYELSGKQGENLEGSINLIFRTRRIVRPPANYYMPTQCLLPKLQAPIPIPEPTNPVLPTPAPVAQVPQVPAKPITPEDIQAIKEIFPSVEDDTIQILLEQNNGDRDETVAQLLRMT